MKSKYYLTITLSILSLLLSFSAARARIYELRVNIFTHKDSSSQRLFASIRLFDDVLKNIPDSVNSIIIQAPDSTVLNMTVSGHWSQYMQQFYGAWEPSDFVSGAIPAGFYLVTAKDKFGVTLISGDFIDASFLDPPIINSPVDGSTVGATPTISWTPIPGAWYYEILLWDEWKNEPVYWRWEKKLQTNLPAFRLPFGELRPNAYYSLRIQAVSQYQPQNMDKRSLSDWVYFYTDAW